MDEPIKHRINVEGIFGLKTRLPLVQVTLPKAALARDEGDAVVFQLRTEEARDLALNLLQGAEGAIGNGFVLTFIARQADMPLEKVTPMLAAFCAYRSTLPAEDCGPTIWFQDELSTGLDPLGD